MCQLCLGQNGHWSNERTVEHYKRLAFSILNDYTRTYRIPTQEIPDFEAEMMRQLVAAPVSYRANRVGMYTILKNACTIWVRKYQKWAKMEDSGEGNEYSHIIYTEHHVPNPDYEEENATRMNTFPDPTNWADKLQRSLLSQQLRGAIR